MIYNYLVFEGYGNYMIYNYLVFEGKLMKT